MISFNNLLLPKKYDIVRGYFFDRDYNDGINNSLPLYITKKHYMLVLNVLEKSEKLIVCLATSEKKYYNYSKSSNNFWISGEDLKSAGLNKKTLLCLHGNTIGIIDCSTFHLEKNYKKNSTSHGKLSDKSIQELEDIKTKNPQILRIMKYLATEGKQMLKPELLEDELYKLDNPWK